MKTTDKPQLYIGIALDKPNENIILASFMETEAECLASVNEQCPGMPAYCLCMFEEPGVLAPKLYAWLGEQGVPEHEHHNILRLIANGIGEMQEDIDEEEEVDEE